MNPAGAAVSNEALPATLEDPILHAINQKYGQRYCFDKLVYSLLNAKLILRSLVSYPLIPVKNNPTTTKMKKLSIAIVIFFTILLSCERGLFNSLPGVETSPAIVVNATIVTLNGNVKDEGRTAVTARGFCWALTPDPTVSNNYSKNEFGPGEFTENIKVVPDTTYYVRAYATNDKGTAYGDQVEFNTSTALPKLETLSVSEITSTLAQSGGNISSDGGMGITSRGVCWSSSTMPTIANSKTNDGEGKGLFVSNLSGLIPNHTYYARAYASNSARIAYGQEVSFKTLIDLPTVTTKTISLVNTSTVKGGGDVVNDGGSAIIGKGVCWSTLENPTLFDNKTNDGTGSGSFNSTITGLSKTTTYFVRAYATNIEGTSFGNQVSFTTLDMVNIALNQPTSASSFYPGSPPRQVNDGDLEKGWTATDAPQWISITLPNSYSIKKIRLLVEQSTNGYSEHEIYIKRFNGAWELIKELKGSTSRGEWLEVLFDAPLLNIDAIQVKTLLVPSWVSWREIEVYGL